MPRPGSPPSCAGRASTWTSFCRTTRASTWRASERGRSRSRNGPDRRRSGSASTPSPASSTSCGRRASTARIRTCAPTGRAGPTTPGGSWRSRRRSPSLVGEDPPDVLHLNDWHTGAVLAALDAPPPSVLSLHNLAYQGVTDGSWLRRLGPRAEHYEWWGGTNPLSGAIALADKVVAVSPNYAREILTPDGGFGLDGAAAPPLGGRERDPQRHRSGRLEPGDRSPSDGDVRDRRRRRRGARRQGGQPAAPSRAAGAGPTTAPRSPRW